MELVVTITTLITIVILQIIILTNQGKNSKLIREFIANRAKNHHDRERFNERRDNSFKQNRTNNQHSAGFKNVATPQPASTSGNIDNVEKSLRDINLKLKNAERDQEAARRKMHDNMGGNQQKSRSNRDNRGGNKDAHRRDRNNRNNWKNRNAGNEKKPSNNHADLTDHPAEVTTQDIQTVAEINPATTPASLPDLNPMDFDADLQHGRKFTVKRRVLQDDMPTIGQSSETVESNPSPASLPQENQEQPIPDNSEISFGRR